LEGTNYSDEAFRQKFVFAFDSLVDADLQLQNLPARIELNQGMKPVQAVKNRIVGTVIAKARVETRSIEAVSDSTAL